MFRNNSDSARPPRERLFEKGDLKYVILDLLKEKPSHGYEIIQALKERFHGLYSPSAGGVYPVLQLLEDLGYVSVSDQDGKKVYTVTEEGLVFLKQRVDIIDRIKNHIRGWWGFGHRPEIKEIMDGFYEIIRIIISHSQDLNTDQIVKMREVMNRARFDINNVVQKEAK